MELCKLGSGLGAPDEGWGVREWPEGALAERGGGVLAVGAGPRP